MPRQSTICLFSPVFTLRAVILFFLTNVATVALDAQRMTTEVAELKFTVRTIGVIQWTVMSCSVNKLVHSWTILRAFWGID